MFVGVLGAGALALVVSLVEIHGSYAKPFGAGALPWLIGRGAIDVMTAVAGAIGVLAASGNPWLAFAIGGLGGPALLRSNFVVSGSGADRTAYGIGAVVDRLRSRVDDEIENASAVAVSAWVHDVVLPQLASLSMSDIENRVRTYLRMRSDLPNHASRLRFVSQAAAEDTAMARAAIIDSLLELRGGIRFIRSLLKAPHSVEIPAVRAGAVSNVVMHCDATQLRATIQQMARDLAVRFGHEPVELQIGMLHHTDEQVAALLRGALLQAMPNLKVGQPTLVSDLIARAEAAPSFTQYTAVVVFGVTVRTGRTMELLHADLGARYPGAIYTAALIVAGSEAHPDCAGLALQLNENQWADADPDRGVWVRQREHSSTVGSG